MLSHFGLFAMYFVGPLVIRLTIGKRDAFVRQHSTEALNGMISFGISWNLFLSPLFFDIPGKGWIAIGAAVAFVLMLTNSIAGARHAYRGETWRYRAIIRFVRGGFPKPDHTTAAA
jgi:uncharacterized Tic20 family protein